LSSTKRPLTDCSASKPRKISVFHFRCGHNLGTHGGMKDMSKPQGLIRRGNVWYCRRRVPLDLIEAFGGTRELKESLHTENYKEAKKRCTLVTAKFDARFDQARGKLNCAGKLSEEAALQAIRTYVACEDKKRAERFEQTDWLEDPDATRDALNETL